MKPLAIWGWVGLIGFTALLVLGYALDIVEGYYDRRLAQAKAHNDELRTHEELLNRQRNTVVIRFEDHEKAQKFVDEIKSVAPQATKGDL